MAFAISVKFYASVHKDYHPMALSSSLIFSLSKVAIVKSWCLLERLSPLVIVSPSFSWER